MSAPRRASSATPGGSGSGTSRPRFLPNAVTRALSPSSLAGVMASGGSTSAARVAALGHVHSVAEIVELVPVDYREVLRTPLNELAATIQKWINARARGRALEQHKAAGTLPTELRGFKPPTFQVGKAFADSDGYKSERDMWEITVSNMTSDFLGSFIKVAAQEVQHYAEVIDPDAVANRLGTAIAGKWALIKESQRYGKIRHVTNEVTGAFEIQYLADQGPSSASIVAFNNINEDIMAYATRIRDVVTSREDIANAKELAKKKLKESADVEMGDATASSSADSSAAVRAEVARQLKEAEKKRAVPSAAKKAAPQKNGKKAKSGQAHKKPGKSGQKGSGPKKDKGKGRAT
ncbi:uncharacterized protein STEHIDRAFT_164075 [Stereum hirsutum FP-91666 SS1]|uniref:Uncharacterized protein n=1 Tax=Stereum hirsutum (strain FP-91666) TaxID=721885 RepID=R7RW99_STEHR|nr:uncharacterized protein STEHIDRAFT_164075 [Stereum hirsutum FP-91666 SS1]EIM79035.1 hypothetical protein STEHIDRAFT_164075 [Stereum hirsutum FP-91666 SS1]